jgi:hypothetical protein
MAGEVIKNHKNNTCKPTFKIQITGYVMVRDGSTNRFTPELRFLSKDSPRTARLTCSILESIKYKNFILKKTPSSASDDLGVAEGSRGSAILMEGEVSNVKGI